MKKLKKSVWFMILDGPAIVITTLWVWVTHSTLGFIILLALGFASLVVGLWHAIVGDASIDPDKK